MVFHVFFTVACSGVFSLAFADVSRCYGTTDKGAITGAVSLPAKGDNFESYSSVAEILGRAYVHSTVARIVIDAYADLETALPNRVFKYGETGAEFGGKFKPHKTHQNGLSVDFFVPVVDENGVSVHLSTHMFNRYGYDIEFDDKGQYEKLHIDYESLAAHIVALDKNAKKNKVGVWRVIFDPTLQPFLFKTSHADYLQKHVNFVKTKSWVRHDEHFHIDFEIPCKPLKDFKKQ